MSRSPFARLLTAAVLVAACTATPPTDESDEVFDPPLVGGDALFEGAPDNETLPIEAKADAVFPATFTDLVRLQSPVKNQASRGVCSIFSTVAYMEHLYLKAGYQGTPDFSEQYLQWSVKNEVKGMTDIEGSSGAFNLEAINKFGIPAEGAWPYEQRRWSTTNDPACTGADKGLPVKCYTNGEPPDAARAAPKFKLPAARFIRTDTNTLKSWMFTRRNAVHLAVKFYYQAWSHGLSNLPVSRDYTRNGWVVTPNSDDLKQTPAGHAIVLVGWDDTLTVPRLDKNGKAAVDGAGKPIVDKGFFIFKNSWGTGSFGTTHPSGAGYGYISYEYVQRYGTANVTDPPTRPTPTEACGNGVDDDGNGKIDCADTACAAQLVCQEKRVTFHQTPAATIPDANTTGRSDSVDVTATGTVKGVSVLVEIDHPARGELVVTLTKGTKKVTLHNRTGGSTDDLSEIYEVADFNGLSMKGKWTLKVVDAVSGNVGTLREWQLEISR